VAAEKVRLRIGNLGKAVLVTGQAYQDHKDALNEFVSNAADEYLESGENGRVRVVLRRRGRSPALVVDDEGRGMSPDRLRAIARNLFESTKAGDDRTLGEKAIGLLAFQQLGGRCDVVSRADDSPETWVLRLSRGSATASLERERRRARDRSGTTIYIGDVDPEVLRVLTQRKVVDYLRMRRAAALAAGHYSIEVIEGRSTELVTPEKPDGIKLELAARQTLWGRLEFAVYVAPADGRKRHVAVVGRAGTTIIDDITQIEEFEGAPWDTGQVSGQIIFEALQQSAGRRSVLRDREAFPVFVELVRSVEPVIAATVVKVRQEVDAETTERLSDAIRRIFGKVLKELADLDNPMRTALGTEDGEGALFAGGEGLDGSLPDGSSAVSDNGSQDPASAADDVDPEAPELERPPADEQVDDNRSSVPSKPDRRRNRDLPTLTVDPEPGDARSRFDPDDAVVYYNDRHSDYLLSKDDEPVLLDYLATLVAKEYVLYNNPRATADDFAEEMVRMLVRVRRHLPRRR
jgi:hypothetical protein